MRLFPIRSGRYIVAGYLSFAAISGHSEVLLQDGFETAGLASKTLASISKTTAGWTDNADVSVVSGTAKAGAYAAKFHFTGNSDPSADAWSELRFDLGKLTPEVWVKYDLYIPANYSHRGTGNNNKFLRLWGNTYGDYEKIGLSTWTNLVADGYSRLSADWNSTGGGIGEGGQSSSNAIAAADRGKWVTFKIYAKAPTASAYGTIKVWKNDVLIIDDTSQVNNYMSGETHAYRYGYILGWANSGFAQDTDFYLDNVIMGTAQSDIEQVTSVASPPTPPALQISR